MMKRCVGVLHGKSFNVVVEEEKCILRLLGNPSKEDGGQSWNGRRSDRSVVSMDGMERSKRCEALTRRAGWR